LEVVFPESTQDDW